SCDRAAEYVVGFVFRVNGQLIVKPIVDMNVRKGARLIVFDDMLTLHVELEPFVLECGGDQSGIVGEKVDIDVRSFPDMAGHHAADEARTKSAQDAHEAECFKTHFL